MSYKRPLQATLLDWLSRPATAFLVSGLELFSLGVERKRGISPKLVLWNNALVNALSTRSYAGSIADTITRSISWVQR